MHHLKIGVGVDAKGCEVQGSGALWKGVRQAVGRDWHCIHILEHIVIVAGAVEDEGGRIQQGTSIEEERVRLQCGRIGQRESGQAISMGQ